MPASNRALSFTFTTEDAQAIASLKRIEKGFKGLDVQVDKTRQTGLTMGNALAGLAIGAGVHAAIGEYEQAEVAAKRTESVIKSTGGVAGVTAKDVDNLSNKLAALAGQDDDVIKGNADLLLSFTNIRNVGPDKIFDEANLAALNLAAGLNTDLKSATLQLGKALNDPVKGMTALRKSGVSFTQQQVEMVKALVASGDTLGAQKVILGEVDKEFHNAAADSATDSGKMKVAFGEAAESAGRVLAPALGVAAHGAADAADVFGHLPVPLQATALGLLGVAYAGPKVADGLGKARDGLSSLVSGLGNVPGKASGAVKAIGGVEGVSNLAAIAVPAVGAAALAFGYNAQEAAKNAASLAQAVDDMKASFDAADGDFGKGLSSFLSDVVTAQAADDLEAAGSSVSELRTAIAGSDADWKTYIDSLDSGGVKGAAFKDALTQLHDAYGTATADTGAQADAQHQLGVETDKTGGITGDAAAKTGEAAGATKTWYGATQDQVKGLQAQWDATNQLNDETQTAIDLAGDETDALLASKGAHDSVQDAVWNLEQTRAEGKGAEDQQRAEDQLSEAIVREVHAADDLARKTAEAEGKQYDAADSAKVQRDKLRELQTQTGDNSDSLIWFGAMLDNAAKAREVKIYTAAAEQNLKNLEGLLLAIQPYYEQYNNAKGSLSPAGLDPRSHVESQQPGAMKSGLRSATGSPTVVVNGDLHVGGQKRDLDNAMARASRNAAHSILVGGL